MNGWTDRWALVHELWNERRGKLGLSETDNNCEVDLRSASTQTLSLPLPAEGESLSLALPCGSWLPWFHFNPSKRVPKPLSESDCCSLHWWRRAATQTVSLWVKHVRDEIKFKIFVQLNVCNACNGWKKSLETVYYVDYCFTSRKQDTRPLSHADKGFCLVLSVINQCAKIKSCWYCIEIHNWNLEYQNFFL